ncbi:uncharacterized protein [Coffea arabica]|uniref:Reverse transcriptase Ty1/copia-type domain-containing protein n=1 Tax=Coffea arabica TaxID=13443 RepID=A0ABM4V0A2_COFAR
MNSSSRVAGQGLYGSPPPPASDCSCLTPPPPPSPTTNCPPPPSPPLPTTSPPPPPPGSNYYPPSYYYPPPPGGYWPYNPSPSIDYNSPPPPNPILPYFPYYYLYPPPPVYSSSATMLNAFPPLTWWVSTGYSCLSRIGQTIWRISATVYKSFLDNTNEREIMCKIFSERRDQWSKVVKIYLTGLGKQRYLTDDSSTEDNKKLMWIQEDAQIFGTIWNSMESRIAYMCFHCETTKEVWNYVRLLYCSNLSRMYDVSLEYFQLQQDNKTVTEYFADLKRVSEELNVIMPLSSDITVMQRQREQMLVLKFLAGLKPEFEPIKSQILAGEQLPSFAEVYAWVLRSASKDNAQGDGALINDKSALVANNGRIEQLNFGRGSRGGRSRGGRGDHGGRGTRECTHCGLKNHTRDTCWDLNGKLPRFANAVAIDQAESSSSAQGSQKTFTISEENYVKFLQYQTANHASLPSASLVQKGNAMVCLSTFKNFDSWIIDSRATDHMSADGSTTKVKGLGTVEINPSLPLSSDLKTKRTIGGGREHNGLYFLYSNGPIACPATQGMSCELDQCSSFSSPVLPVPSSILPELSSSPDSTTRLSRSNIQVYSRRFMVEKAPDMLRTSPINSQFSDPGMTPSCESNLSIALHKGKRHCTSHPISNFVSYSHLSLSYSSFVVSFDSVSIPKTITHALNDPGWRLTMQEEMLALEKNGIWDLVSLHSDLEEKVYMEQSPGFVVQGKNSRLVCRLKKSLYGLKQSRRAWFGRFSSVVIEFSLTRCGVDYSVFYRYSNVGKILLVVYVDDIVITGDDIVGIQKFKSNM